MPSQGYGQQEYPLAYVGAEELVGADVDAILSGAVGPQIGYGTPQIGAAFPRFQLPGQHPRQLPPHQQPYHPNYGNCDPMAVAVAMRQLQQGALVTDSPPTRSRKWAIGFDSVAAVAASTAFTLTQQPQVLFRPDRVVIPSTVGGNFTISQILVGQQNQLAASGALPGLLFAENAVDVGLKMDTCSISMQLVISGTNIDAGAGHRFTAAMIGMAVL